MAAPVKVARQQIQTTPELSGTFRTYTNTRRNSPEPSGTNLSELSGTYLRNLRQHTPTLRNLPEPAGTCLRNLHHFTPNSSEPSGICLRNLNQHTPEPPEPSGTRLRNLHQHTPELSGTFRNPASGTFTSTRRNFPEPFGTFRNLPPEPAPATRTGTHQSLSGLKTPLAYAVGEKKETSLSLQTRASDAARDLARGTLRRGT